MTLNNKAKQIVYTLQRHGHQAVFAGGSVRDMLLNQTPHDIDIATSATPDQVQSLFKNTRAVGKAFGVVLVKFQRVDFEVATFRNDGNYSDGRRPDSVTFSSIEEDASRRDFTVNALFFDPKTKRVLDYVNGLQDLENKVLRFVGNAEDRIKEDNLRLLRAIRFALKLGFEMDPTTSEAVRLNAHLVQNVAAERIREEFMKMLAAGQPRKMLDLLFFTGLLHYILPEVENLYDSQQDPQWHPEGTVYEHTVRVMEKLVNEPVLVQLAGLFHDIGKPATQAIENGRITNHGHDALGATMTEEIMMRLKFSNDEISLVKNLVADHMLQHQVKNFRRSTLKRYLALPYINELTVLNKADVMSGSGDLSNYNYILQKRAEWKPEEIKPTPLITGRDLINLGFKPGPQFGVMLQEIEELQLEGKLKNSDGAIKYAREKWL